VAPTRRPPPRPTPPAAPPGPGRCVPIFLDKNRRYIGKSQSKRPPKTTQRPPHRRVGHQSRPSQPRRAREQPHDLAERARGRRSRAAGVRGRRRRRQGRGGELVQQRDRRPEHRPLISAPRPDPSNAFFQRLFLGVEARWMHSRRRRHLPQEGAARDELGRGGQPLGRGGGFSAVLRAEPQQRRRRAVRLARRFHPQYFWTRTCVT
jgi:hypothetical protein